MTSGETVAALAALAQENRLDVFRLLVRRGPEGAAAGDIAEALGIAAATLPFHLKELRNAGLTQMRRNGRSLIYSANYQAVRSLIDFLTEHCCASPPSKPRRAESRKL
jgi:DNA-binding transcriptional ArsR family regulator